MRFLSLLERTQLKLEKEKNKKEELKNNLFLSFLCFLKIQFYNFKIFSVRIISLFLGDSSDNYLIFTKLSE
ncbi:MAG: hypothetical protein P1P85_05580, partial [Patescibacteria group bacterium]|nr:hypothetical protein [Patescibacteria group bacterium]